LEKYPNLFAGDQINPSEPRKWLLVRREASLPSDDSGAGRWFVDHLFLDQEGIPTIVEVKRSTDSRIRREVVGQMLDYAANAVVYWPIDMLRAQFDTQCQTAGYDPVLRLAEFLGPDVDIESFWQRTKTNLQAGKIRLLFVADQIPPELRRIVEFLNQQMDPAEILALEIKQYVGEGLKTLVPNIIGQTMEAQQRKGVSKGAQVHWDEESFFNEFKQRNEADDLNTAKRILEWAKSSATWIYWGAGKKSGSFVPIQKVANIDNQLFAVYTYGSIEIYFQHYKNKPGFSSESKRLDLVDKLNAIQGVSIPTDAISRRPSIPLATFNDENKLSQLLAIFDWVIGEITKSYNQ